jgi:hypothetical protein
MKPPSLTYIDESGFIVMQIIDDLLHVVHCYSKPGVDKFPFFIEMAENAAKQFNCSAVTFITRRPKGFAKVMIPKGYKEIGVMFGKEVSK